MVVFALEVITGPPVLPSLWLIDLARSSPGLCFDISREGMEFRLLWRQASLIEFRLWSTTGLLNVLVSSCDIVFFIMALYFWLRELFPFFPYAHCYGLLSIWSLLERAGLTIMYTILFPHKFYISFFLKKVLRSIRLNSMKVNPDVKVNNPHVGKDHNWELWNS